MLLRRHIVGRYEAHAGNSGGKHEGQATVGAGLAQCEVPEFPMDELLFNDEGIVTVALLGFLRRDGMAGKVAAVGIVPIEKRCRRIRLLVPALYLPPWAIGSQMSASVVWVPVLLSAICHL